jgi:hypothetical protein
MTSFLVSKLKKDVARAFKGKLKTGKIQNNQGDSQDDFGDIAPPDTAVTYSFNGIRENFDAAWMARALIPETDVSILILLGSVSPVYIPVQDDLIFIESLWHKVRKVMKIDPAGASIQLQCYVVPGP